MGISWIDYKEKKILYVDYSGCQTKEETITVLEAAANVFRNMSEPILSLDNYEGGFASDEFMAKAKELSPVISPKRIKGAALGVKGIKKFLLRTYNLFTKDKIIPFDSRDDALNYLVQE